MKNVGLSAGPWSVEGLVLVESFFERLRGLSLAGAEHGIVIRRSAVHTIGMSYAIETVAIDARGRVTQVRTLPPNRFAWFPGARYVVELPPGSTVPQVGSLVEVAHGR